MVKQGKLHIGKRLASALLALAVMLALLAGLPVTLQAENGEGTVTAIEPGEKWLDTNGEFIQAHGGSVFWVSEEESAEHGGRWWWVGEDKTSGRKPIEGVRAYSSTDLMNWTDHGTIFHVMDTVEDYDNIELFRELYPEYESNPEDLFYYLDKHFAIVERPKVVYNEEYGIWVMWFHSDGPTDTAYENKDTNASRYSRALAGVAVADSITGPFKFIGASRLYVSSNYTGTSTGARDSSLYKDDDGSTYYVYNSENNAYMYIAKLNDSYTGLSTDEDYFIKESDGTLSVNENYALASNLDAGVKGTDYAERIFSQTSREAPAIFKYEDTYYFMSSACDGWKSSATWLHTSDDILADSWTRQSTSLFSGSTHDGNSASDSFASQSTYVIPYNAAEGQFIYMGDRWWDPDIYGAGALADSRYIWLPFTVEEDGSLSTMYWYKSWDTDVFEDPESTPGVMSDMQVQRRGSVSLPLDDVVTVTTPNGSTVETPATWSVNQGQLEALSEYESVVATGYLHNGQIERHVEVLPGTNRELVYYADLGYPTTYGGQEVTESAYFNAVAAEVDTLRNTVTDQAYDANDGWGRNGSLSVRTPSNTPTKWSTGWYSGGTSVPVSYTFTLDAGLHEFAIGASEWWGQWNTSRPMTVQLTYETLDGTKATATLGDLPLSGSGTSSWDTEQTFLYSFDLPADGEVTLDVKTKSGSLAPQISWVSISKLANKAELQVLYDTWKDSTQGTLTDESWQALSTALAGAQEVLASTNVSQEMVNNSLTALQAAVDGLQHRSAIDALKALVEQWQDKAQNTYTDVSWGNLQAALEGAVTALAGNPGESEAQTLLSTLENAIQSLARSNVALGKTASSQSVTGSNVAANAIDGSMSTRFETSQNSSLTYQQWFMVDLEGIYSIEEIAIYWYSNNAAAQDFTIEFSLTGEDDDWHTAYDVYNIDTATNGLAWKGTYEGDSPYARYIRLNCTRKIATYGYSINEFEVYGAEVEMESLEVTALPKTEYAWGESLDLSELEVTAHYTEGLSRVVTSYTLNHSYDAFVSGTYEIEVEYEGKTVAFEVTVAEPLVTGIAVTTPPDKTEYEVGETFDAAGMVVEATLEDGSTQPVNLDNCEFTYNFASAGDANVIITYETFNTQITVTVVDTTPVPVATGISADVSSMKTTYETGESLDTAGLAVWLLYDIGDPEAVDVNDCTITGFNSDTAGTCIITVAYGEFSTTFLVWVTNPDEPELLSIQIASGPDKTEYAQGEDLVLDGLVVEALYGGLADPVAIPANEYTVTGYNPAQTGTQTLTVTYQGKTATFTVTVAAPAPVTLTGLTVASLPTKQVYELNDALDTAGLVVKANYSDGNSVDIANDAATTYLYDFSAAGSRPVTVQYGGFITQFYVTVNAAPAPAPTYGILQGGNSTYSGENAMVIGIDAPFEEFTGVRVNGELLTLNTHYTVRAGSVYVTLLQSYLGTLENGTYNIEILFANNTATTTFVVNRDSSDSGNTGSGGGSGSGGTSSTAIANTGDKGFGHLLALGFVCLLASAVLLCCKKRIRGR